MAIIGRKLGMTRVFAADGTAVPVTVIEAGPCPVLQVNEAQAQLGSDIQMIFDECTSAKCCSRHLPHRVWPLAA